MVETHFTLWHNTCETRPVCFVSSLWKLNLLYYQVNCQLNQAENNLLARFGQVKKARSRELSEPPEQPINLWVNLQEKLNLLAGFGQFKGAGSNSGRCFTLREKDNFDLIRQEFFSDHRLLSRRSKACSSSRTQHLDLFLCSQSVMVPRLFISEVARFVRTGFYPQITILVSSATDVSAPPNESAPPDKNLRQSWPEACNSEWEKRLLQILKNRIVTKYWLADQIRLWNASWSGPRGGFSPQNIKNHHCNLIL